QPSSHVEVRHAVVAAVLPCGVQADVGGIAGKGRGRTRRRTHTTAVRATHQPPDGGHVDAGSSAALDKAVTLQEVDRVLRHGTGDVVLRHQRGLCGDLGAGYKITGDDLGAQVTSDP